VQEELAPAPLLLLKIANRNNWKVFCSAHQSGSAPFSQSFTGCVPSHHPLDIFSTCQLRLKGWPGRLLIGRSRRKSDMAIEDMLGSKDAPHLASRIPALSFRSRLILLSLSLSPCRGLFWPKSTSHIPRFHQLSLSVSVGIHAHKVSVRAGELLTNMLPILA
jgi:hypothetical protein